MDSAALILSALVGLDPVLGEAGDSASAPVLWPPIITHSGIVRSQRTDDLDLFPADLSIGGGFGFPQDFLPDSEIMPLLSREIRSNDAVSCATDRSS